VETSIKLRSINISSTSVDGTFLEALTELATLNAVTLRCARLDRAGLKRLAALQHLRWVVLHCPTLHDADLAEVDRSPMELLKLYDAKLSGKALTALANLPKLSAVQIDEIDLRDGAAPSCLGFRGSPA
jgi:hypothetical protein